MEIIGFYCALQYIAVHSRLNDWTMASNKTTTLTFRIQPVLKEALRAAAAREHRSIANMVEVLIWDYCGRNGVTIASRDVKPDEGTKARPRRPVNATNDRRPRNR